MSEHSASNSRVEIASLVHELRQPLFSLRARLQLASGDGVAAEEIAGLLASLTHMEDLLDRYTHRSDVSISFDLRNVVEDALQLVGEHVRSADAVVVTRMPEHPVDMHGHPTAVRQVVVNLLHNALEAVSDQLQRHIEVRLSGDPERAVLVVLDSGRGVAHDIQERVFEPFVSTKERGVSGLGLYIARDLVHQANGQLTLDTPANGGTRARVELPR